VQNPSAKAPPTLTDRKALLARRGRATEFFLHQDAVAEVQDRLIEVNRSFTAPAVVTPFADVWRAAFPGAVIAADDDQLALAAGAHDLVIHALCLHWANDPVGQLVQCRRALRPDGLCLVLMFGGQTLHELRAALAEAEASQTGGLSPRVLPMGEIRDLGALLQRAGFALPVADSYARQMLYRDLWHLMHDLRAMGETNALSGRLRRPTRRGVFSRAAQIYARHHALPHAEGRRIPATFEMVALTGWAAHDSQQKPLRPGSAVARLADALNQSAAEAGAPKPADMTPPDHEDGA
jgi:SAM-dependent methyltransferase